MPLPLFNAPMIVLHSVSVTDGITVRVIDTKPADCCVQMFNGVMLNTLYTLYSALVTEPMIHNVKFNV